MRNAGPEMGRPNSVFVLGVFVGVAGLEVAGIKVVGVVPGLGVGELGVEVEVLGLRMEVCVRL